MAEERNGGESKEEGDDGRAVMTMVGRPTSSAWSQAKKKGMLRSFATESEANCSNQHSHRVSLRIDGLLLSRPHPLLGPHVSRLLLLPRRLHQQKIGDREFFPFN